MTESELAALLKAGAFVESLLPRADWHLGAYSLWYGWAIREAWLAGYRQGVADGRTAEAEQIVRELEGREARTNG